MHWSINYNARTPTVYVMEKLVKLETMRRNSRVVYSFDNIVWSLTSNEKGPLVGIGHQRATTNALSSID